MYEIEIKKKIIKFINNLSNSQIIWSKIKILKLFKSDKKLNLDMEKMRGKYKNLYRIRIGEIRLIFEVLSEKIIIKSADYRGKVY
ncbi:MAG: type II toxin-antitoxin system RelE/ParE family toxin [Nanoarchaeota archaeon]